MTKEQLLEKLKSMMSAYSCCAPLKAATQNYLDAVDTADEQTAAKNLLAEIEKDITPIDGLVAFAHSARAVEIFGADRAKKFAAHADELKASGAKYCDCAACAPAVEILANKDVLLN